MWTLTPPPAACAGIRRVFAAAALVLFAASSGAPARAAAGTPPDVTVIEKQGVYTVTARFAASRPPEVVLAVLTDYERIPRFMPDVRKSLVLERSGPLIVIEQEAVSTFLVFSKRVHLVLEIFETPGVLRFRDRCGDSFTSYGGAWRVEPAAGGSAITYELVARPAFDVPEFVLKRLLRRDSLEMIDRLQREIAAYTPR